EQQADEILNLRLYQLTGLEREKIVSEYKELIETINDLRDILAKEQRIISITHAGFIKRTAVSAFRAQRRGGKGVIGMQTREGATEAEDGDFVQHLFAAT